MAQSSTVQLAAKFAQDETAVLNAMNEWLSQFDVIPIEGDVEVTPLATGNLVELKLQSRIRTIADAIRLAATTNETIARMVREPLPESTDLIDFYSWASEQQDFTRDLLEFLGIQSESDSSAPEFNVGTTEPAVGHLTESATDYIEFGKISGLVMDTKHKTVFRHGHHYERFSPARLSANAWDVLAQMARKDCRLSRQEFSNLLEDPSSQRKETARELREKLSSFHVSCRGDMTPGFYKLIDEASKKTCR